MSRPRIPKDEQLATAVGQIESLLLDGYEFPDACWKVSCRFNGLTYEEIQAAYDEATGATA